MATERIPGQRAREKKYCYRENEEPVVGFLQPTILIFTRRTLKVWGLDSRGLWILRRHKRTARKTKTNQEPKWWQQHSTTNSEKIIQIQTQNRTEKSYLSAMKGKRQRRKSSNAPPPPQINQWISNPWVLPLNRVGGQELIKKAT